MTLVLTGKNLVLEGPRLKTEDKQVPGIFINTHITLSYTEIQCILHIQGLCSICVTGGTRLVGLFFELGGAKPKTYSQHSVDINVQMMSHTP